MDLAAREACCCFGSSKMTCINEEVDGDIFYNTMKPVELMEYIARAADLKFEEDIPLENKIEMALDIILPVYGMHRVKPGEGPKECNESDDSVNWDNLNEDETLYTYFKDGEGGDHDAQLAGYKKLL
jgi:hypothetical protein